MHHEEVYAHPLSSHIYVTQARENVEKMRHVCARFPSQNPSSLDGVRALGSKTARIASGSRKSLHSPIETHEAKST